MAMSTQTLETLANHSCTLSKFLNYCFHFVKTNKIINPSCKCNHCLLFLWSSSLGVSERRCRSWVATAWWWHRRKRNWYVRCLNKSSSSESPCHIQSAGVRRNLLSLPGWWVWSGSLGDCKAKARKLSVFGTSLFIFKLFWRGRLDFFHFETEHSAFSKSRISAK